MAKSAVGNRCFRALIPIKITVKDIDCTFGKGEKLCSRSPAFLFIWNIVW